MKLSIVIICWNDAEVIGGCLASVFSQSTGTDYEVILSDNHSSDGSVEYVQAHFPGVKVVQTGRNLGFGGGNNAGFRAATGDFVLILNPDTIIQDRAIEKLLAYAESRPEAGAFGCRVLNADGSYQPSAYPIPTVRTDLIAALNCRWLGRLWPVGLADVYPNWHGTTEREVGFQAGCCLLIRGGLLKALGGFDEQLFHQYEDADLCFRVWKSGKPVRFYPDAKIIHIGGQNRGRYPIRVVLETQRSRYRFFHKHYGEKAAQRIRWVALIQFGTRWLGYGLLRCFNPRPDYSSRLAMYRVLLTWHWRIDPIPFIRNGAEPDVGHKPLSTVPVAVAGAGAGDAPATLVATSAGPSNPRNRD